MKKVYSTLATIAMFLAAAASAEALTNDDLSRDPKQQTAQIKSVISEVFADMGPGVVQKMIAIADCESYGGNDGLIMHVDPKGKIVENSSSGALGVFQILLDGTPHVRNARKLGYDLTEVTDNIRYGRFLVDDQKRRGKNIYTDWVCA